MADAQAYIEKRKFKRVNKKIAVTYKVVSIPNEAEKIKASAEKNKTETMNISLGGMQLVDGVPFIPGQIVRLEIKLDDNADMILTFAEVKWSVKDDVIKRYRTGIEFLVLKEEDKIVLEKSIK
ncbi:MAG: PilZ domain-containing protein [bacterium]